MNTMLYPLLCAQHFLYQHFITAKFVSIIKKTCTAQVFLCIYIV